MATSEQIAQTRQLVVENTVSEILQEVQELWRDATADRIRSAMHGDVGLQILNAVIRGQLSVAQGAQAFVSAEMMAEGVGFGPEGDLSPGAFAGMAADGRPLPTLLYLPALTTAVAYAAGEPGEMAMLRGLNQMATLVSTTVADTSRSATTAAMAAEPRCVSYVRVVNAGACARCLILAGRQYSYSTGFQRHPNCVCGMKPMSHSEWEAQQTPEQIIRALPEAERVRILGQAGAEAFDAGADLGQLVNARRKGGIRTTTEHGRRVSTTSEGTTRRGVGGRAMKVGYGRESGGRQERTREARLTPESIMQEGRTREERVRLLRRYGYIT